MTWNGLERIEEVDPQGIDDAAVLRDLRDVLRRHSAEGRFGISLLHSHFDMAENEVLVEYVDADQRTLTIKPEVVEEGVRRQLIGTSWRLDQHEDLPMTATFCWRPPNSQFHGRAPDEEP